MRYIQLYENFSVLNETTIDRFSPDVIMGQDAIDSQFFNKLMPKTAKTTSEAQNRILSFSGGAMFVHQQYLS